MLLAMKTTALAGTGSFLTVPPALDVVRAGDHQVVHVGATPIATYPVTDVTSRRHVYNIYEKGTRVRGAGVLRTLVLQDDEGQIPVLTSCGEMSSAKVVHYGGPGLGARQVSLDVQLELRVHDLGRSFGLRLAGDVLAEA